MSNATATTTTGLSTARPAPRSRVARRRLATGLLLPLIGPLIGLAALVACQSDDVSESRGADAPASSQESESSHEQPAAVATIPDAESPDGARLNSSPAAETLTAGTPQTTGEPEMTEPLTAEQAWAQVTMRRPMSQVVTEASELRVLSPAVARALTEDQWAQLLTPEQYRVLRNQGTEFAGSGPLLDEKRDGTFHCAGCGQALYPATWKFDSGCGWPSFYQAFEGAIENRLDTTHGMIRTENVCSNCGGHLGHVFEDAPNQPSGLRYCMNSVALIFIPDGSEAAEVAASMVEGATGEANADPDGGE